MDALASYIIFFAEHGPLSSWLTFIETMLVVLSIVTLLILNKERWTIEEKIGRIVIWSYLYLIFLFTFLSRSTNPGYKYKLLPFWSYQYIATTHDLNIVLEVMVNSLMFVPMGILVPWTYRNYLHEDQRKELKIIILFGLIVSVSVECIQLLTRTGYFEWDDIVHNMIGLIVGYGFYLWMKGKKFVEIHRYFLPLLAVCLALLVAMI